MTAVDVDVDVTVLEDLDFAITCTILVEQGVQVSKAWRAITRSGPCGEAAVTSITCRVCKSPGYCCDTHRALIASSPVLACAFCNTRAPGIALFDFALLGAA